MKTIRCPVCGRVVNVHDDGRVMYHSFPNTRMNCHGSGHPVGDPKDEPKEKKEES